MFEEIHGHLNEICQKSGLSEETISEVLSTLLLQIEIIPSVEFNEQLPLAKQISPDEKDVTYFALALKRGTPIWSNDFKLKQQNLVKVVSTQDLTEFL